MPGADRDIIDFRSERARHEQFLGRDDVLAELDASLSASRGWVLVTGQPGMGKSAILTRWLDRAEQAGLPVPHHFLRRGVADWDRPEAIARSLAAQIERIHPAQADPEARPQSRLLDLLGRVSRESFRDYVGETVGPEGMREHHRRLLATIAAWPAVEGDEVGERYALKHAVGHALAAGEKEKVRGLCKDVAFLEGWCREGGVRAIEEGLREAGEALPDEEVALLHKVVRAESHWLREEPGAMGGLVYNRLRSAGWEARRIRAALSWGEKMPAYGLRHPVRMGWERTLVAHDGSVKACAVTPDGHRIVSASSTHLLCAGDSGGNLWILEPSPSTPDRRPTMPTRALKLFYSYAHKDEALREDLEAHLSILKRQGLIEGWHDRTITGGTEWAWPNQDEAWTEVARGIRKAIDEIRAARS